MMFYCIPYDLAIDSRESHRLSHDLPQDSFNRIKPLFCIRFQLRQSLFHPCLQFSDVILKLCVNCCETLGNFVFERDKTLFKGAETVLCCYRLPR